MKVTQPKKFIERILAEGLKSNNKESPHSIGYTYANKAFTNPGAYKATLGKEKDEQVHEDGLPETRRAYLFREVSKLVASYDNDWYEDNIRARSWTVDEEDKIKPIPNKQPFLPTTLCCLVAMRIIKADRDFKKYRIKREVQKNKEYWYQKTQANKKRILKMNTLIDQMGEEAFNKKKQKEQAASRQKKAEKVSTNFTKVVKFIGWRGSPEGKKWDRRPVSYPLHKAYYSMLWGHETRGKSLGWLKHDQLYQFIINRIEAGCTKLRIQFSLDPADPSHTLWQYIQNKSGVTNLKGVSHFSTDGVKFSISGWSKFGPSYYLQLDNKCSNIYHQLPREWHEFEDYNQDGIVGNPKLSVNAPILVKLVPQNLKQFWFYHDSKFYQVGVSRSSTNTVDTILSKIPDKYKKAKQNALKAAQEEKEKKAAKAKAAEFRKKMNIPSFPVGNNKKEVVRLLTKQLAEGTITPELYAAAMAAIN